MEAWKIIFLLKGWLVGSMLIFQGVIEDTPVETPAYLFESDPGVVSFGKTLQAKVIRTDFRPKLPSQKGGKKALFRDNDPT